ncbi:phosphoribosyltransferase family protein [Massilia sp. Dwa41.01b]|uniref:ComF family protein n=1 Tax=Massilia sp. Dwa41.01b TaxID=2709302 RepID=UPI0028043B74|nr:phosphoribosyltransferase family protein [Massilia sp. Dwa41.01b]
MPGTPGPGRLVERGYNQALEIARPLARGLGIALAPRLLTRVVVDGGGSPASRRANGHATSGRVRRHARDGALVSGRHIGVVDDVMTSGHTLNEVAATLKAAGAARVSNLVFARTPPH